MTTTDAHFLPITLKERQSDLNIEREMLVQSRAELDEMLEKVKKQLKHETQMRMVKCKVVFTKMSCLILLKLILLVTGSRKRTGDPDFTQARDRSRDEITRKRYL